MSAEEVLQSVGGGNNGDEIPVLDISYASLIHVDIGNKKLAKLGEDLHKVREGRMDLLHTTVHLKLNA